MTLSKDDLQVLQKAVLLLAMREAEIGIDLGIAPAPSKQKAENLYSRIEDELLHYEDRNCYYKQPEDKQ